MKTIISIFIIFISVEISAQNDPEKFQENQKWGVNYKGKVIFPAIYDYVSTTFVIITKKDKEINIYDSRNFQLLYSNIKAFEYSNSPDPYTVQIITKDNEMKIFDNDGVVTDYSIFKGEEKSRSENFKNSTVEELSYYVKNNQITGIRRDFRNKDNHPYATTYALPKGVQTTIFLNNIEKLQITNFYTELSDGFELDYSEKTLFEPLKYSYVITKVKGKFGVWDFKDKKIILPFKYDKIISYQKYVLVNKDGLSTFYPNIGAEPKYKKLTPYIGNFTRFETSDGKTGWIDRKGKEYFDK